jgi:Ca-activated chloride channel family protein
LDEFNVVKDEADSIPSDDWHWAAAVAGFGMILRDSEFKGDVTLERVRSLASGAQGDDPLRAEFIELIDLYQASVG